MGLYKLHIHMHMNIYIYIPTNPSLLAPVQHAAQHSSMCQVTQVRQDSGLQGVHSHLLDAQHAQHAQHELQVDHLAHCHISMTLFVAWCRCEDIQEASGTELCCSAGICLPAMVHRSPPTVYHLRPHPTASRYGST